MTRREIDIADLYPTYPDKPPESRWSCFLQDFEDFKFLMPLDLRKQIRSRHLGEYLDMPAAEILKDPNRRQEYDFREKLVNIDMLGTFLSYLNHLGLLEFIDVLLTLRAQLQNHGSLDDPNK